VIEVWPENVRAVELFRAMGTQWRFGRHGPIGLDHNVLFHRMDRMKLNDDEYEQLDADIRIMEAAALGQMIENNAE
jgi:hypothetical protein